MTRWLSLALTLTACTAHPQPAALPTPPPPPPPPSLSTCPTAPPAPPPLPRILTAEALAQAVADLDAARLAERRRGDACARLARELAGYIARSVP